MSPKEELAAKYSRIQHAILETRARAESHGVTVETDGNGCLTALRISPEAHAHGPEAVSDLVMRTYRTVAADAADLAQDLMMELYDDSTMIGLAAKTDSDLATPHNQPVRPSPERTAPPPVNHQPQVPVHSGRPTQPAENPATRSTATPPREGSPEWIAYQIAQSRAARANAEKEALRAQARQWEEEDARNRRHW